MKRLAAILFLAGGQPALAHGGGEIVAPSEFLTDWHPDLVVGCLTAAAVIGYAFGHHFDRRRGKGTIQPRQAGSFYAGAAMMALALLLPLESLSATLFSAHMLQHLFLIAVAPPLFVIGRPDVALMRLVGPGARRVVGRLADRGIISVLLRPVPAALIHAAVVWLWHAPPMFAAALADDTVHALEHATFLVTALLFWYAVLASARSRSSSVAGLVAITITMIQGGLLGALLTLAPRALYPEYGDGPQLWGLTAMLDQQLGGLLMWVPMGAVYLAAGVLIALRLTAAESRQGIPNEIQDRIAIPARKTTTAATES